MRERRQSCRAGEPRVEPLVDAGDQIRDRPVSTPQSLQDRRLAHPPVCPQRPHVSVRIADHSAVGREVGAFRPLEQAIERGHVVCHRPIRRGDDGRRPAHDVVTGEKDVRPEQCEGEVVGGMAGRGNRLQAVAGDVDDVTVSDNLVGREIGVGARVEAERLVLAARSCRPMRSRAR